MKIHCNAVNHNYLLFKVKHCGKMPCLPLLSFFWCYEWQSSSWSLTQFTVLIQVAEGGGGRRKRFLYLWSSIIFWTDWFGLFKMHVNTCTTFIPVVSECQVQHWYHELLPSSCVSRLVQGQNLPTQARGTCGNVHHWALCSMGGGLKVLKFSPFKKQMFRT